MSNKTDAQTSSLNVDLSDISKLIDMLKDTDVKKVSISPDGAVEITMKSAEVVAAPVVAAPAPVAQPALPAPAAAATPAPAAPAAAEPTADESANAVRSPMVGTAYLSPSPGAQPFVAVGQAVKKGDVLCLVEAMKMFNKIKADRSGKLVKCCIDDSQPVEFDQPLFIIE